MSRDNDDQQELEPQVGWSDAEDDVEDDDFDDFGDDDFGFLGNYDDDPVVQDELMGVDGLLTYRPRIPPCPGQQPPGEEAATRLTTFQAEEEQSETPGRVGFALAASVRFAEERVAQTAARRQPQQGTEGTCCGQRSRRPHT